MTPAVKAMVEAMAAEVKRQAFAPSWDTPYGGTGEINAAHIDLEKVARAGLEAIKGVQGPALKAVYQAADDHSCYVSAEALAAMIDAILKAAP